MSELPEYLSDQTEDVIRERMLASLPSDLDKSEGSFIFDALSPVAIEMALGVIQAQEVLRRGFAKTTYGAYLDLRADEHGITRLAAVKAIGQVKFMGVANTLVPLSTVLATPADTNTNSSSIEFVTTQEVTLDEGGEATAAVVAVDAGLSGNVSVGSITLFSTFISGVMSVTNLLPTSNGLDIEDDDSFYARYLKRVRSPSAGGNKADYVNWTLEVSGVGGVAVIPVRDGPGTVSIAILGSNQEPASPELVDTVQAYIAPVIIVEHAGVDMALGAHGVSMDEDAVLMEYAVGGAGTLTDESLDGVLSQPGIWQVLLNLKVSDNTSTDDLLEVGIWNVSAADWATTTLAGSINAKQILQAHDLEVAYSVVRQYFYWSGQDQIALKISRLQSELVTDVYVSNAEYRSTFSSATGDGKAPIGARVSVESADSLLINVTATLTTVTGYNVDSVKAAAQQNIADYIRSLAFADDNDVRYVRIGQAILDTTGVQDYASLLVNGGSSNITVDEQEVAVIGTVTLS